MTFKSYVKQVIRVTAPPLVRNTPIDRWPGRLGRTLGVKVPQSLEPQSLALTTAAESDGRGTEPKRSSSSRV
jgi:hypothetical protein